MTGGGYLPLPEILPRLQENEKKAAFLLKETGVDHVIYGMKIYEGEKLAAVHFYMWPMSEEEFCKVTGRVRNSLIYALHRR